MVYLPKKIAPNSLQIFIEWHVSCKKIALLYSKGLCLAPQYEALFPPHLQLTSNCGLQDVNFPGGVDGKRDSTNHWQRQQRIYPV